MPFKLSNRRGLGPIYYLLSLSIGRPNCSKPNIVWRDAVFLFPAKRPCLTTPVECSGTGLVVQRVVRLIIHCGSMSYRFSNGWGCVHLSPHWLSSLAPFLSALFLYSFQSRIVVVLSMMNTRGISSCGTKTNA